MPTSRRALRIAMVPWAPAGSAEVLVLDPTGGRPEPDARLDLLAGHVTSIWLAADSTARRLAARALGRRPVAETIVRAAATAGVLLRRADPNREAAEELGQFPALALGARGPVAGAHQDLDHGVTPTTAVFVQRHAGKVTDWSAPVKATRDTRVDRRSAPGARPWRHTHDSGIRTEACRQDGRQIRTRRGPPTRSPARRLRPARRCQPIDLLVLGRPRVHLAARPARDPGRGSPRPGGGGARRPLRLCGATGAASCAAGDVARPNLSDLARGEPP